MPLTDEWINEQLEICEKAVPPGQLVRSADTRFIAAAREGYPLVLKEVMRLRAEQNAEAECVSCGEMFPQSELVDEMCDSCRSYSGTDC